VNVLGQIIVRVGLVNNGVKFGKYFPQAELEVGVAGVFSLLFQDVFQSLVLNHISVGSHDHFVLTIVISEKRGILFDGGGSYFLSGNYT